MVLVSSINNFLFRTPSKVKETQGKPTTAISDIDVFQNKTTPPSGVDGEDEKPAALVHSFVLESGEIKPLEEVEDKNDVAESNESTAGAASKEDQEEVSSRDDITVEAWWGETAPVIEKESVLEEETVERTEGEAPNAQKSKSKHWFSASLGTAAKILKESHPALVNAPTRVGGVDEKGTEEMSLVGDEAVLEEEAKASANEENEAAVPEEASEEEERRSTAQEPSKASLSTEDNNADGLAVFKSNSTVPVTSTMETTNGAVKLTMAAKAASDSISTLSKPNEMEPKREAKLADFAVATLLGAGMLLATGACVASERTEVDAEMMED